MITYLKDHIKEEIEGAKDYMTKALALKKSHPDMSWTFYNMAQVELDHANCLTKMFNKMEKPESMSDSEHSTILKEVVNAYSTSMSEIESMKKLYFAD